MAKKVGCSKGYNYDPFKEKCRITTHHARKTTQEWLRKNKFDDKVTARTVSFADLARDEAVFVEVKNWKPNPRWSELKSLARSKGFFVE